MIPGVRLILAAVALAAISANAQQQPERPREQTPRVSVPSGQLQRSAVINMRPILNPTVSDEAYREILRQHETRTAARPVRQTATAKTRLAPPPTQNSEFTRNNEYDCNDSNRQIYPGAPEQCDGLDNNCDGRVDEGLASTFYLDADGDGWGDGSKTYLACSRPDGYADRANDCDDRNLRIFPTAPDERGNGIDENCNGEDG